VAKLQWRGGESPPDSFPTILQGVQEEILEDMLQHPRSYPYGWLPTVLGRESGSQEP